ncbi:MAG: Nif11-like leader peptide family natural product precursor [Actinomycetota bacterium]|nr:Nif11-like leader peptide family natural product precursor [Actinomycetota bacterium]MDQ6945874.1 Nif11-like leader peptide family natural product precursor [Actinomycetota bacterium]
MLPTANVNGELMEALRFLRAVREDAAIRARLERLDPAEGLEPVVAIAGAAGFVLSIESLRGAHGYD